MELTKEQALDLVKVLSHYQTLESTVDVDVHGLCSDLEEFVLSTEEDEETDDEEDEEDDEAGEDSSEEEDDEEPDESEDDKGNEADDEGEETDECSVEAEAELGADIYVRGNNLHDLKVAKGKVISSSVGEPDNEVTLEFENTEGVGIDVCDNVCDLLVNGDPIGPITHVRRTGTELHVADNNSGRTWHRFYVARFPKGWADELPLDNLAEVE